MAATAQAVLTLAALGRPLPSAADEKALRREELPEGAKFELSSPFFQPDQPGQARYLHRIVAPIRAACGSDEATALELMRWLHRRLIFHQNSRNEAALIIEDGLGACGPQARCLAGLLEATGVRARFLMVGGHCTCEGYIDGRWCLLDAMFNGAFRGSDGRLYSALDVHEQHRRGEPEITTFGDWRYESYTIYEPKGGAEYHEFAIAAGDTAGSPSARAAYPEPSG
jgi:transglutaminase-like putative cysteine protease